ncbi:MAG TPA: ion channel [Terrimicrobiaceae bacterium]
MTTVGYGDKTPQTPPGRLLAFLWMFLGILLVSAFTGAVSSSITLAQLRASIGEIDDLARFRDGVMRGSLAESMLVESGIPAKKRAMKRAYRRSRTERSPRSRAIALL